MYKTQLPFQFWLIFLQHKLYLCLSGEALRFISVNLIWKAQFCQICVQPRVFWLPTFFQFLSFLDAPHLQFGHHHTDPMEIPSLLSKQIHLWSQFFEIHGFCIYLFIFLYFELFHLKHPQTHHHYWLVLSVKGHRNQILHQSAKLTPPLLTFKHNIMTAKNPVFLSTYW